MDPEVADVCKRIVGQGDIDADRTAVNRLKLEVSRVRKLWRYIYYIIHERDSCSRYLAEFTLDKDSSIALSHQYTRYLCYSMMRELWVFPTSYRMLK